MLKIDAKTKRILLWLLLGFVVVIAVLVIIAVTKKPPRNKGATGATTPPGNTGTTVPTVPSGTPTTSTPPFVPPVATGTTGSTGSGNNPLPTEVIEINWTYIQDLVWKMDEVTRATGTLNPGVAAYKCEITNGIIEMGARDLSAMVQIYRQWYGRSFRDNYCQKVTSSGCWTALWDNKPKQACEKLKPYA